MAKRYGPFKYEYELGKRNYSATATVDAFIKESEARMIAIARQSIQNVINDAQHAVAKGGRMRVDTGFLRASGQASYNGMPSGPGRGERKEKDSYTDTTAAAVLKLGDLEIGSTFHFGWSANYARYREAYDGFLEGAVQKWQQFVTANTNELRKRIEKK